MEKSQPPEMPQMNQPPPGLPYQPQFSQETKDAEHIKILAICHYVSAGLTLLMSLWAMIYVVMGGMMMTGGMPASGSSQDELMMMGGMFFFIGVLMTLMAVGMAVMEFIAARMMTKRRGKIFCLIVAGLNCMNMPLGTALGVFTFIVLLRPSVQASFDAARPETE